MINQIKTNSLEENIAKPEISPDTFIIHTMQDDLEGTKLANANDQLVGNATNSAQDIPRIKNLSVNDELPTNSPFEIANSTQTVQNIEKNAKIKPLETIVNAKKINTPDGKSLYKILFSVVVLSIISIIGIGFYYIYTSSKSAVKQNEIPTNIETENKPSPQNIETEDQVIITPTKDKYSSENPNFLTIDSLNLSQENLKNQLIGISEEIKNLPVSKIYEFIIVDKNNNPITLKFFSENAKLVLSPNVTKKLSQDFSLFFYNDNGNVRLGIKIKTLGIDKKSLLSDMINQEKTLPEDISILFLGLTKEDKQIEFTTSKYDTNNETVRYLNINSGKTLSIDYMVTEKNLIIGTSKETLRKMYLKSKDSISISESSQTMPTQNSPLQGNLKLSCG